MPNTQAIGVAFADPEFTTCYVSQEFGYTTAAQTAVTQATSKSTGVTANTSAGRITMNNASLGNNSTVVFRMNNSTIKNNDVLTLNISGGVAGVGDYLAYVADIGAGYADIALANRKGGGGSLSEAVKITFTLIGNRDD